MAKEKASRGNEAFNNAMVVDPPKLFTRRATVLYLACFVCSLCSIMNGYEASIFNSLLETPSFKNYFQVQNSGIWAGIVSSTYEIGSFTAFPFIGPALDTFGRRFGLFTGTVILVIGTLVQGTTIETAKVGQYMAGRFLLGFGIAIAASAGPTYLVEMCHPAYRGVITALYNTFWFVGSIIASGAVRGALSLSGNAPWLLPTWLQLLFPGTIIAFVWFLPESPRWLHVNRRDKEAREMLIKYHGDGNADSVWDYRALFHNRASIYRLGCNCLVSIFGQWAGNAVISYFLSAVLDTAGISNAVTQVDINIGLNCLSFVLAIVGANLVDRVGRRPLLLATNAGCCVTWVCITVTTAVQAYTSSPASARATVGFIYLFGAIYAVGFNPLLVLYPVEVLSFEMRGKGMAFSYLAGGAANLLNQFAWPVALGKIGWKTYICFIIWCAVQTAIVYFLIPETKNRTLEQLDEVFEAKNPVKRSLERKLMNEEAHPTSKTTKDV